MFFEILLQSATMGMDFFVAGTCSRRIVIVVVFALRRDVMMDVIFSYYGQY
jgi:hypothetical protein